MFTVNKDGALPINSLIGEENKNQSNHMDMKTKTLFSPLPINSVMENSCFVPESPKRSICNPLVECGILNGSNEYISKGDCKAEEFEYDVDDEDAYFQSMMQGASMMHGAEKVKGASVSTNHRMNIPSLEAVKLALPFSCPTLEKGDYIHPAYFQLRLDKIVIDSSELKESVAAIGISGSSSTFYVATPVVQNRFIENKEVESLLLSSDIDLDDSKSMSLKAVYGICSLLREEDIDFLFHPYNFTFECNIRRRSSVIEFNISISVLEGDIIVEFIKCSSDSLEFHQVIHSMGKRLFASYSSYVSGPCSTISALSIEDQSGNIGTKCCADIKEHVISKESYLSPLDLNELKGKIFY
jgi:hypothetical protein